MLPERECYDVMGCDDPKDITKSTEVYAKLYIILYILKLMPYKKYIYSVWSGR